MVYHIIILLPIKYDKINNWNVPNGVINNYGGAYASSRLSAAAAATLQKENNKTCTTTTPLF